MPLDEAEFFKAYSRDSMQNDIDKQTFIGHFVIALDMARRSSDLRMHESINGEGKVFIIQAADDKAFTAEQQEAFAELYPGAKKHMFQHGGHFIPITRRDEIGTFIEEFLLT